MNIKYLCLILCAFSFSNLVSGQGIELSKVETRAQLDSIIALLPTDGVRVDSLPQRKLQIQLDGKFTIYGVQTDKASFSLYKEELSELSVKGNAGFQSLLNNMEQANGLGVYKDNIFSWNLLSRQMKLRNYYRYPENLFEISDENDFVFECKYLPHSKNPITALAKESTKNEAAYYISSLNYYAYGLGAEMWLNGIQLLSGRPINEFLVSGGEQKLKIVTPTSDGLRLLKTLEDNDQSVDVDLIKKTFVGRDVQSFRLDALKEQTFLFNVDIPEIHPKLTIDLRKIPNIKEELYSCYEKLYKAFLAKDKTQVLDIILPYYRTRVLTYNYDEKKIYEIWSEFNKLVSDTKRVRLLDKSKLDVSFSEDGTLVKLTAKDDGVLYVMSRGYDSESYTFYFYQDESGDFKIYF